MDSSADEQPVTRRWKIPPAVVREPGEQVEGMPVLDEFRDGRGAALFVALRDVLLWGETLPDQRHGLFAAGAPENRRRLGPPAEELRDAWLRLVELVAGPDAAQPGHVSAACLQVAAWAASAGRHRTALGFTQAAALLQPTSGTAALATGEAAVRAGQPARARTWFHRTIAVARRSGEHAAYARAHLGLGRVLHAQGELDLGAAHLHKALRAAHRYGVHGIRGDALLLLSRIARARGRDEQAERLVDAAVRAQPRDSVERRRIQVEIARVWLSAGEADRALSLLLAVTETRREWEETAALLGVLVRAAGAVRDRSRFDEAWSRVWHLIRNAPGGAVPAEVYDDLAAGAESLWPTMQHPAPRADAST
jgi:tetratricopeptide (TPR) repeat protein